MEKLPEQEEAPKELWPCLGSTMAGTTNKGQYFQTMITMKREEGLRSDSGHIPQVQSELPCWSPHLQSSLDQVGTREGEKMSEPKPGQAWLR